MKRPFRKTRKIIVFISSFVLVYLGIIIYTVIPKTHTGNDIERYNTLVEAVDFLPKIDELNNYSNFTFKFTETKGLFSSCSYILKVSFSKEEFNNEKNRISENYYYDKYITDVIRVDTFDFKLLDFEKYELSYPKSIVFIGISEPTNEVVYIYYEDKDLDYIEGNLEDFIVNNCNW